MNWRFWERGPEVRDSSYSALLTQLIASQAVAGLSGEVNTSAVESAAGSLSRAFMAATVEGPDWAVRAVNRTFLSRVGRDLILTGYSVHVIDVSRSGRVSLVPASGFGFVDGGPDPSTWTAEVSLTGPSLTQTRTVRYESLIWVPWSTTSDQPFAATGPVGSASITAKLHSETEKSLRDESAGPLARLIPVPRMDSPDPNPDPDKDTVDPLASLRQDIRTARGAGLLLETVAAGWGEGRMSAPHTDWKPNRLGPNPPESLVRLRRDSFESVLSSCGVPPSLFMGDADGTAQREGLRRWHMNLVVPFGSLLEDELSMKLETDIRLRFDAYPRDQVGRAQTVKRLVDAGVPLSTALQAAGIED